jgi:hypothetical protein
MTIKDAVEMTVRKWSGILERLDDDGYGVSDLSTDAGKSQTCGFCQYVDTLGDDAGCSWCLFEKQCDSAMEALDVVCTDFLEDATWRERAREMCEYVIREAKKVLEEALRCTCQE